jgi:multidrug efflux system membrane fusion protein
MRGSDDALLLTLFIFTLSSAACSVGGSAQSATPQGGGRGGTGQPVPVTIAPAVRKPVPLELRVIGSVEPSSSVAIRAQVTGELTAVTFREGDDVRKGQVLFRLDRRPLEAALGQARANLQRDTAQAANARAQSERVNELAARGIATREQVDTSSTNAAALDATLAADRAAVENATVQLQYATIPAPISGRTGVLQVHPGNLVRANDTTPLVVINQIAPVNVSFAVPESQLPTLKHYLNQGGVQVMAEAPTDEEGPSQGHITFVDNAVDPTTGTIRIKASFPNADRRLWPGQFVNVTVTLSTDEAVVVPTVAIQVGQQGSYVFVVKDGHTVEMRPVDPGRAVGEETIVDNGVREGETVVTDGQLQLVPGASVTIRDAPKMETGA